MTQLAIVFWDWRVAWFELLFYKTFYINAVSMNSRSSLPNGLLGVRTFDSWSFRFSMSFPKLSHRRWFF